MIEMGQITGNEFGSRDAATFFGGSEFGPLDCQLLVDAWEPESDNPFWRDDPSADVEPPTGGLSGELTLIDVAGGTISSLFAVALDDFSTEILNSSPESSRPDLRDANNGAGLPVATSRIIAGNRVEDEWATGIEAVSALLASQWVYGRYSIEPSIGGTTRVVLTFPTRGVMANPDLGLIEGEAILPFTELLTPDTSEQYYWQTLDEDGFPWPSSGVSEVVGRGVRSRDVVTRLDLLSGEGDRDDFGALYLSDKLTGTLSILGGTRGPVVGPSLDGDLYQGLPVIGVLIRQYVNGNLESQTGTVRANYGDAVYMFQKSPITRRPR